MVRAVAAHGGGSLDPIGLRRKVATLDWIPSDEDLVTFVENYQLTETLFESALDARQRGCDENAQQIARILLSWSFKGAHSDEADHRFRREADHPVRSSRSPVGAKRRGCSIMPFSDRLGSMASLSFASNLP